MEGHVRAALLAAFRHVFQPLVRLALRNGISYQEFCTGLKRVFVETVQADFQIPGQEMTPARIGILTGLTREDVSFVQEEIERGIGDELIIMGRIGKLIEGWTSDGDFTGPYGIPLELRQEEGKGGFPALVKRYGGKMTPGAMLRELKRVGVVQETKNRKIRLLSRSYIAGRFRPEAIDRMGRTLGDLAETLEHNLNPLRPGPARFERRVYTPDGVDTETLLGFRKQIEELGQGFLESLDNWLSEKEQEEERKIERRLLDPEIRDAQKVAKVGVGVFLFEHHDFGVSAEEIERETTGESGDE
jgi:hypothetical protein